MPASGGSSIGISVAHGEAELLDALTVAFYWDNTAVVEHALTNFTELNCAVLGSDERAEASEVEQPVGWTEFLTYSDKYEKGKFKSGSGRKLPADLPEQDRLRVRAAAIKAFHSVGASGIARVDFMLDNDTGTLYVNEINTVPGSLAHYLFEYDGLKFSALLDRLIGIALGAHAARARLSYQYKSDEKLFTRQPLLKGGKV